MPKGVYFHKPLSDKTKQKIGLSAIGKKKGKSYEEMYGIKKAFEIKEKMRNAKLNKKRPFHERASKGEKHWNWIPDRTKVKGTQERNNPEYKQWRMKVWKRDGFKCRIPDSDCSGKIVAHHIVDWAKHVELRYKTNNGITLCQFHHPKKRNDERRLIPIFNKLVGSK